MFGGFGEAGVGVDGKVAVEECNRGCGSNMFPDFLIFWRGAGWASRLIPASLEPAIIMTPFYIFINYEKALRARYLRRKVCSSSRSTVEQG